MINERPLFGKVEIEAWDAVEEEWIPWLANAKWLTVKRGGQRDGLGIKTDVGLLTFQLLDTQDPLDGGTFYPGQPVRVMSLGDVPAYDQTFYETTIPTSGNTEGWTNYTGSGFQTSTSQAKTGTYSLRHQTGGGGAGEFRRTFTGLTVGRSYTVTVWVYRATSGGSGARIGIVGGTNSSYVTALTTWTQITHTFTASATSHIVSAQPSQSGSAYTYWDDWKIVEHVPAGLGMKPLFTGRIAHFGSAYPMDKATGKTRTEVTVTVADAVQIHGSTMRYGVDLGVATNETFESRIDRLEESANAPVEVPVVGGPSVRYAL